MTQKNNTFKNKKSFSFQNQKKKRKNIRISKLRLKEKILQIKRVTKVVKGGKKMTFRAVVAVGDLRRKIGLGVGRADDIAKAIEKAILNAKKHMINAPLTKQRSIPHFISSSFGASKIMMRPAALGTGVIAGGAMRPVLELAGVKNALAKQFGSKNILNNAKASIQAFKSLNRTVSLAQSQSKTRAKFYKKIMKEFKEFKNAGQNLKYQRKK